MTAADDLASRVDAAIASAVDENRIVGCVVAVARRGVPILTRAAGFADREAGRAMTPDAIFLLASVTKAITAATALALAERGQFDPDAPVTSYLPDFKPRFGDETPTITARHLMTHTAGLSYPFMEAPGGPYHRAGVSSGLDQPGLSRAEAMRRLASVPLIARPGTAWNYALGLDVLGEALAAATGRPFATLVRDHVTGPLGMADTDFCVRDPVRLVTHFGVDAQGDPLPMGDDYSGPTAGSPARFATRRLFDPNSYASGGAGLAGTARDMLAFVEALRLDGSPILSQASVRAMTADALPPDWPDVLEPGWSHGLGLFVLRDPGRNPGPERPGAFRGSGGYGHTWICDPARELSVVAMTNSAPEGVRGRFVTDIREAILGAPELQ